MKPRTVAHKKGLDAGEIAPGFYFIPYGGWQTPRNQQNDKKFGSTKAYLSRI